ncbi:protein FAR1-RELATED SEQUENCE 9-like [Ziziphus jujuba]|uniref:Protein FAR1-RELATED SEQUENCE n=1 Tax=Ziziphus jujuba TaxID=326968 RepID=A0A6P4AAU0_ZIZJJ|nr:protein FAR1-RELATED SEQUENCE 9-like [Ziziphus jujuba]
MEKQMAKIYTRKIFLKFQDELWQSLVTMPQLVHENDTHKVYMVESGPHENGHRAREIAYDKGSNYASCSCKKFESQGIPCKHILAFLRLFGNIPLPNNLLQKSLIKPTDEESSAIVSDSLKGLLEKLNSAGGSKKSGGMSAKHSNVCDTSLKDPSQVRAKGCGRRLKRGKEIAIKTAKYRGRRCNGYEKIGESHDKRNYPILNSQ